jgi:hypothetical protein
MENFMKNRRMRLRRYGHNFIKTFSIAWWRDDFMELGFNSFILDGVQSVIESLYSRFGRRLIDAALEVERNEIMASLLLESEAIEFSDQYADTDEVGPSIHIVPQHALEVQTDNEIDPVPNDPGSAMGGDSSKSFRQRGNWNFFIGSTKIHLISDK